MVIEGITLPQMVGFTTQTRQNWIRQGPAVHAQLVQLQGIVADGIACFVLNCRLQANYGQIMEYQLVQTISLKPFHFPFSCADSHGHQCIILTFTF